VSLPVDIRLKPSFATYVGLDIALISSTHPTIYFSWLHQYLQYEHFLKLKDVSQYRCFASLSKVLECSGNPATATSLTAFPAMAGNFHKPENLWHQSSSTSLPPAYYSNKHSKKTKRHCCLRRHIPSHWSIAHPQFNVHCLSVGRQRQGHPAAIGR